ncbi:MAG: hypothetical protein MK102_12635 [Fuerstiella sp.]|nr:hypothetical protein [Fuerstiella sp.]
MNRFLVFCIGLLLMCSMTGCCLLGHGCCGGGYGAGYPYGAGSCPGGACGAAGPGYPTAFAPGTTTAFVDPVPTY